ncbi:MAG: methyltransferase domain-containing protein [Gemmatimonadetes bacterium]|nr:methyltransferase domain-containing protein [Gemmatimonadota bacterium]
MKRERSRATGYGVVLKEYARLAKRYDRRWSFYIHAGVQETTRRLDLKPTDRLLDVGCGTGALLHALSRSFPAMQLARIDPSPEMLGLAGHKLGASVELHVAWAERIPYPNDLFDVVASCSVFHYLRQPMVALKEMLRVLRPGGSLVITDWCDDYLACRVCDRVLRVLSPAHFRTYRERECRELLQAAGVGALLTERYKINWLWGLMTVKGKKRVPGGRCVPAGR